MINIKIGVTVFALLLLISCNGCLNSFYQVHEEVPDLNIRFVDLKIAPPKVLHYLDSIYLKDTTSFSLVTSFNDDSLNKDQRVIFFKSEPVEYYRIDCNDFSCWIKGIFNKNLDSTKWIFDEKKLSNASINRIRKRFQNEILYKIK
jgi:hypothetical protein